MCGITGVVADRVDQDTIDEMVAVMNHRGPDEQSTYIHNRTALGHARLSIIDLNTGSQPIFNKSRTKCIIYNGEIYNYVEIREKLKQQGLEFSTQSDTEVILLGYEHYGTKVLNMLNGIFAFAIYDIPKEELFLARDHYGIKPLHYYFKNGIFLFGSEQKSILQYPDVAPKLNLTALHQQVNLRYTQDSNTLFSEIKRLKPAHYLLYKNGNVSIHQYWKLNPTINTKLSEKEAIDGINMHLKEAVRRQLVSDVPLGVYLSGGMDSSAIVEKMHGIGVNNINTFTLGFNEPTDEFSDARIVADCFNTIHRESSLNLNPLDQMGKVIWHAEEPKINLLQGYHLSDFASQHVKVVLGGLGGDELFAGYDIHKFIYPFNSWHKRIPDFLIKLFKWKSDFIFKLQHKSKTLRWDEYRRGIQLLLSIGKIEKFYLILRNVWDFDNPFYESIYSKAFVESQREKIPKVYTYFAEHFEKSKAPLDKVLIAEFNSKMVNDYLLVEDRMSMSHGIEERVPFLDRELVEFAFSIPIKYKVKNNQTKAIFRKALQGSLPERIIRKKKWGFSVNPYLQFKKDLQSKVRKELTKEYIAQQGIFNYDYIHSILDYPAHPKLRWHYNFLWILLGLKVWHNIFEVEEQKI